MVKGKYTEQEEKQMKKRDKRRQGDGKNEDKDSRRTTCLRGRKIKKRIQEAGKERKTKDDEIRKR